MRGRGLPGTSQHTRAWWLCATPHAPVVSSWPARGRCDSHVIMENVQPWQTVRAPTTTVIPLSVTSTRCSTTSFYLNTSIPCSPQSNLFSLEAARSSCAQQGRLRLHNHHRKPANHAQPTHARKLKLALSSLYPLRPMRRWRLITGSALISYKRSAPDEPTHRLPRALDHSACTAPPHLLPTRPYSCRRQRTMPSRETALSASGYSAVAIAMH
jgi:hypothetical protein